MKICLINPAYPYGKAQTYLGGSITTVGAQMLALGHQVFLIDLNLETVENVWSDLQDADIIGISVVGAPYIPEVIELCKKLSVLGKQTIVGGQVIAKLGEKEFETLFCKGVRRQFPFLNVQDGMSLSLVPILKTIPDWKMKEYLQNEMTLVVSQGCIKKCDFCAAEKKQNEKFKPTQIIKEELIFLAKKAKEFNIKKLNFYASNLDFFQNAKEIEERLKVIAKVQEESDVEFYIRALSCMESFQKASREIFGFKALLKKAGLWCVGFGIDGLNTETWKEHKKYQNKNLEQVWNCLKKAVEVGVVPETLLVMGFREEGSLLVVKHLFFALWIALRYKNLVLRPYLAKHQVPGNDHWGKDNQERVFVKTPAKFMNLDFCTIGSKETHPRFFQRWTANTVYLLICFIFGPIGKCATSPLLPQGKSKLWNRFADFWNKLVPFDR